MTNIPREQFDKVLADKGVTYGQHLDNLESHFNGATPEQQKRGRIWYRAGGDVLGDIANKYGITKNRAIAMAAALSARTDWNNNLHFAAHMAGNYRPGENEHEWKRANIHPTAMARYMEDKFGIVPQPRAPKVDKAGNSKDEGDPDPSVFSHQELLNLRNQGYMPRTKADWEQLANAHGGVHDQWVGSKANGRWTQGPLRGFEGLNDPNNPQARADWLANAQLKSRGGVQPKKGQSPYEDAIDAHLRSVKETTSDVGYRPGAMYTGAGVPTLGNNIEKAKLLRQVPEEDFEKHLSGPKYKAFFSNLGNSLRFRQSDDPNDQGYYDHGGQHWSQHDPEFLRSTVDTQHMRASSTPHGQMNAAPGYKESSDITPEQYEVYQQGLADLTHRINSKRPPNQQLMPHQVQAIIWGKFKDDINAHEGTKNGAGQTYWSPTMKDINSFDNRYARRYAAQEHVDPRLLEPPHSDPYVTDSDDWWNAVLQSWEERHQHELSHNPMGQPRQGSWTYDVRTGTWNRPVRRAGRMSEETKKKLFQQLREKGGFSHGQGGKTPDKGFMVSLPNTEQVTPQSQTTPDTIGDFAERNKAKIKENPDNYHGGWNSPPEDFQDVSRNYQDLWDAVRAGRGEREEDAQHGIYHIPSDTTFSPMEFSYGPDSVGYHMGRHIY